MSTNRPNAEPPLANQPNISQLYKLLVNFIDETRNNFSATQEERNHDYDQLQLTNRNIVSLEGKVENLTLAVNKMADAHKRESRKVAKAVETEVSELKETVAPKKFIVKMIPHFSIRLWLRQLFTLGRS